MSLATFPMLFLVTVVMRLRPPVAGVPSSLLHLAAFTALALEAAAVATAMEGLEATTFDLTLLTVILRSFCNVATASSTSLASVVRCRALRWSGRRRTASSLPSPTIEL